VIRILITILAITLSAPAISVASMMQNRDVDWVGPSCCGSESDTESEESEINSACCCSLSPLYHSEQVSDSRLLSSERIVAMLSGQKTRASIRAGEGTRISKRVAARGPPQLTLLSQHTLLLI